MAVFKDYYSCNVNQVPITSAGMWKVSVAALPSPKATFSLLPCIPLSLCRHSLCLPATFLPCRPLLQQFSPAAQPSGAASVPLVIMFEGKCFIKISKCFCPSAHDFGWSQRFFSHLLWSNSYMLGSWMPVSIQGLI